MCARGGFSPVFSAVAIAHATDSLHARTGAICFGPNLSKFLEPDTKIYVAVDDFEKKPFDGHQGEIAFDQLDLDIPHQIKLLQGEKQFESFVLVFRKLKTNFVALWKAAGAWRIISVGGDKCEWPVPHCPEGRDCR